MKCGVFLVVSIIVWSVGVLWAQNPGDHFTAGYNPQRTYLSGQGGDFKPPLELVETLVLPEVASARTLLVFEDFFLVGEGGSSVDWHLLERATGEIRWSRSFAGEAPQLSYLPAVAGDVVLLGGAAGAGVEAVRVSTGATLWSDESVGSADGRHPVLTGDVAVYSGESGLAAVAAETGVPFWTEPIGTAGAPLSLHGNRLYLLTADGSLQARDLFDGRLLWSVEAAGSDGSNIIATEKFVFVNNPETGDFGAVRTADGSVAWENNVPSHGKPGIALAYEMLLVFSAGLVQAHDPVTGVLLWEREDHKQPVIVGPPLFVLGIPGFTAVANHRIYYFSSNQRIRVLDVFSGNFVGNIVAHQFSVQALSVADGKLFVLSTGGSVSRIQVYAPVHEIYFPHVADGGPPEARNTTLLTLTNLSPEPAHATVHFHQEEVAPLVVDTLGLEPDSSFEVTIGPKGSVRIQTLGDREEAVAGWARVVSDRPLAGTAVFQVGDETTIRHEAGVSDAAASGSLALFVHRFELSGNRFSTGIAVANPSDEAAEIEMELRPSDPGQPILTTSMTLGSNAKRARFLEELFEEIGESEEVEGTLVVSSDVPVAVTALRTQNGLQMSSYPVAETTP